MKKSIIILTAIIGFSLFPISEAQAQLVQRTKFVPETFQFVSFFGTIISEYIPFTNARIDVRIDQGEDLDMIVLTNPYKSGLGLSLDGQNTKWRNFYTPETFAASEIGNNGIARIKVRTSDLSRGTYSVVLRNFNVLNVQQDGPRVEERFRFIVF